MYYFVSNSKLFASVEDNPFLKWDEPGIGRYLFMMSIVGVTAFTILLIKEYELLNKVSYHANFLSFILWIIPRVILSLSNSSTKNIPESDTNF